MREVYLNDLLGFGKDEIRNIKIRFNQFNGEMDPLDEYIRDPEIVNTKFFLWRRTQRFFSVGQIAICFLKISSDLWLLTTIKKIVRDYDVLDDVNYYGEELEEFKQYFGRVMIKFHKNIQAQGVYYETVYQQLEVSQILPTKYDGEDFPGYDKVRLSFKQLETVLSRHKKDWISALENQKAVYLITDKNNGKLYVGSATSAN